MPNNEYEQEKGPINNDQPKKLMSVNTADELTSLFIEKLIEKKCTLSNFEEISDNVQLYFKNNATITTHCFLKSTQDSQEKLPEWLL